MLQADLCTFGESYMGELMKMGTRDAFERPAIIEMIGQSLISPAPECRKLAAEILIYFASYDSQAAAPRGIGILLGAFDKMEQQANLAIQNIAQKVGRFDIWLHQTAQIIDGRGRMGSRVGAKVDEKFIQEYGVSPSCIELTRPS